MKSLPVVSMCTVAYFLLCAHTVPYCSLALPPIDPAAPMPPTARIVAALFQFLLFAWITQEKYPQ